MSMRNIFQFFIILVIVFCDFCELAFADRNSFGSVVEEAICRGLTTKEIEKAKSDYAIMKACRGIDKIKTKKKVVALTFDDGPHQKYTREILDLLSLYDIKATFFVIGKNAQHYPNVIKEIDREGHVLGNHTYSHFYLPTLSDDEIEAELINTNKIIYKIVGKYPIFFRPPYGACSDKSTKIVRRSGLITIAWSDMTNDYDVTQTSSEKIADDIIKRARPGAIIGLHDGGGNREKTVVALAIIIRTLRAAGYEFLTIPQLLDFAEHQAKQE
jgi:peptidoglycan/xylan/chitin deacetylase (PgdA/CDA1 family)